MVWESASKSSGKKGDNGAIVSSGGRFYGAIMSTTAGTLNQAILYDSIASTTTAADVIAILTSASGVPSTPCFPPHPVSFSKGLWLSFNTTAGTPSVVVYYV